MATSVTVRMYNQLNLGDCFLLKFKDGKDEKFVLIDFGSFEKGNESRELEIATSIKETVGENPLSIVLTHQHMDHLSGFISAESVFSKMNITELWLSYLDDPQGKEAIAIRKLTEKFWKKNIKMKDKAREKFGLVSAVEKMLDAKDAVDQFAEDLFAEGQTGGKAISNLLGWCKKKPEFLLPGKCFDLPGLPKNKVNVFVLGPPTDDTLLRKLQTSKGDAVEGLQAAMHLMNLDTSCSLIGNALNIGSSDFDPEDLENFPFNKKYSFPMVDESRSLLVKERYLHTDTWRRIDYDWLSELGRVSLHMSDLTNNSSLVLAFQLVDEQKVLLFAADAQIGNWKSWSNLSFDTKNGDAKNGNAKEGNSKEGDTKEGEKIAATDLLRRTVLYKAGHHSSHNATLADSLDLMNEDELVIMIPVNEEISTKRKFAMLKQGMLKGYNRKSHGRVLRSDTIFHNSKSDKSFKFPFAATPDDFADRLTIVNDRANESHLYIEYIVK